MRLLCQATYCSNGHGRQRPRQAFRGLYQPPKMKTNWPSKGKIAFDPEHLFSNCPQSPKWLLLRLAHPGHPFHLLGSNPNLSPTFAANAMDAMFDALDEFLTKMQEADRKFTVFPHNLLQYAALNTLPLCCQQPGDPSNWSRWMVGVLPTKLNLGFRVAICIPWHSLEPAPLWKK